MSKQQTVHGDKDIKDARKLLKPPEVVLHKLPRWLIKRITAYRKKHGIPSANGWQFGNFQNACLHILNESHIDSHSSFRFLDHWGTSKSGPYACCKDCFVAEPYGFDYTTAKIIETICRALDLVWHVSSNSYWYPGRTIRITIHER